MKVVTSAKEQTRILKACHFEPSSGHFGVTKTWRRIAERFHWKGLYKDVVEMVSDRSQRLRRPAYTFCNRLSTVMYASL